MRILRNIILVFLALSFVPAYGADFVTEEEVKTAFIYHFLNYTEWNDQSARYNVCIPDDESLRMTAEKILASKKVNGRAVMIVPKAPTCHVLVSNFSTRTRDTLAIGYLSAGAQLEFRMVDNKLRFAVDLKKLKKSNFKISSQLLKLAILEE